MRLILSNFGTTLLLLTAIGLGSWIDSTSPDVTEVLGAYVDPLILVLVLTALF